MDKFNQEDKKFMSLALKLARKAKGDTRPNPMVGAVIVKDGRILSTGYHKKAGKEHAEIEAIKKADEPLEGASLFVTLEPCNIHAKTPPCVDQLIKHRFAEVIIGSIDPNPSICGKGVKELEKANIKVRSGLMREEVARQNEEFFKNMKTGLPFITSKIAASLDGKIASASRDSKWITSDYSRRLVYSLRKDIGCILTGLGTVVCDDPYLLPYSSDGGLRKAGGFWRVIFDSGLKLELDSNIAKTLGMADTIIFTQSKDRGKIEELEKRGGRIEKTSSGQKIDIYEALSLLYKKYKITSVLLEAGPSLNTSFLREGAIDKMILFFAPIIIGGDGLSMFSGIGTDKVSQAISLDIKDLKRRGRDYLLTVYPREDVYRNNQTKRKNQ